MEFSVYHIDRDQAEFSFIERGIWCESNCNGKFEIGLFCAYFELKEDYVAYIQYWEREQFYN